MQWQMRRYIMHKETLQAEKALTGNMNVGHRARCEPHGPGFGREPGDREETGKRGLTMGECKVVVREASGMMLCSPEPVPL